MIEELLRRCRPMHTAWRWSLAQQSTLVLLLPLLGAVVLPSASASHTNLPSAAHLRTSAAQEAASHPRDEQPVSTRQSSSYLAAQDLTSINPLSASHAASAAGGSTQSAALDVPCSSASGGLPKCDNVNSQRSIRPTTVELTAHRRLAAASGFSLLQDGDIISTSTELPSLPARNIGSRGASRPLRVGGTIGGTSRRVSQQRQTGQTAGPQNALKECINNHQPDRKFSTWWAFSHDRTSPLWVAAAFASRRPARAALTVVTQLSYDRLPQLLAQCRSWHGPISAAVYVAVAPVLTRAQYSATASAAGNSTEGDGGKRVWEAAQAAARRPLPLLATQFQAEMQDLLQEARRFFKAAEATLPCQLDMLIAYEVFNTEQSAVLYPVNVLRNYARLQAHTPLIALLDVDMLTSASLFHEMQQPGVVRQYKQECKNKTVYVLPAFSLTKSAPAYFKNSSVPGLSAKTGNPLSLEKMADQLVALAAKPGLYHAFREHEIVRFDPNGIGHVPTDYSRWFRSQESYEVTYKARFEPWVLAERRALPWHDARFRGYGQNKIVHIEHLNMSGYRFVVHSQAFILHRAHAVSGAKLQHAMDFMCKKSKRCGNGNGTVYGHTLQMGNRARADMESNAYMPVVDMATRACRRLLPWWRSRPLGGQHISWADKLDSDRR